MNINPIHSSTLLKLNTENFIANSFGNEMVIMNLETDDYMSFNSVGTDIIVFLQSTIPFAALLEKLKQKYNPEDAQWAMQVEKFVQRLIAEKIITIASDY